MKRHRYDASLLARHGVPFKPVLDAYSEGEPSQRPPWSHHERSYHSAPRSPPRAPRAILEQSRAVTPPPPNAPSEEYIALVEDDPARLEDPHSRRKLLVLDLNGTLLHRSQNNVARVKYHERGRDSNGRPLPRLRPVHPRPYMPAFRSYLFASRTKAWLDVMVWSSAQPHSVGDMVDKCFGEHREKLIAVWARDTLGLSNEHYFQKVQTVKDLAKPWSLLLPQSAPPSSPHSSTASTPRTSLEPSSPSKPSDDSLSSPTNKTSPQSHSALTTLLLDDSPRKAELQPFNHVCIGEYTGDLRVEDLESLQKEQDWNAAREARQQLDSLMAEPDAAPADLSALSADYSPEEPNGAARTEGADTAEGASPVDAHPADQESFKKRKRKGKKLQKRAALFEQLGEGSMPGVSYDKTLLAVVGVLDEIKAQANVAAWIRSGGLWGPHGPPATRSPELQIVAKESAPPSEDPVATVEEEDGAQSEDSTLSVGKGHPAGNPESDNARKRPRKRRRISTDEDVAMVGNDDDTTVPVSSLPDGQGVAESKSDQEQMQKMWFEDPEVIAYWVARGWSALDELGIPVEHGLER